MLPELPEAEHLLARIGVKDQTVTEYLWDQTRALAMPILLHGCLPAGFRLSYSYYKNVVAVLEDFDVPTATFHPYWRNGDLIEVDNPDFKVSFYTRPEAPRALLVVGNLSKQPGEATIGLDMKRFFDWRRAGRGMNRIAKPGQLLQVVERVGARDARILEVGPNHLMAAGRGTRPGPGGGDGAPAVSVEGGRIKDLRARSEVGAKRKPAAGGLPPNRARRKTSSG